VSSSKKSDTIRDENSDKKNSKPKKNFSVRFEEDEDD
jgi:hypothetical protein